MKNSIDIGTLFLRIVFGLTMSLAHGAGKLPPSEKFLAGVTNLGFPLPYVFAWSASLAEFAGGLAIAAGLFTRPSAFFVAVTMAVAFFGAHGGDPFKVKELSLLYGSAAIAIIFLGGGRYSLDAMFRDKLPKKSELRRLVS